MPKFYMVDEDYLIERMFLKNGWEEVRHPDDADLLQFTGGEDVDPTLYEEARHPTTFSNPLRDSVESNIFHNYKGEKSMAGICRGGQFLNVMNGGKMYQDVDRHTSSHEAFSLGESFTVTSTHHQMMRPSKEGGLIVLYAKESLRKETSYSRIILSEPQEDVEAIFYPKTNCFCYQPHPEYVEIDDRCQSFYFDSLRDLLNLS